MPDLLTQAGTLNYEPGKPYEIRFDAAQDLLLPFRGTMVVPSDTTEPDFGGMYRQLFLSLRYPTNLAPLDTVTLPVLRTFNNRPLEIKRHCLIMVADDTTLLDSFHPGELFSNIKEVYDPPFKNNIVLSSYPRYIVFLFDGNPNFSADIDPISRQKGLKVRGNTETDVDIQAIRDALGPAPLSGQILTFDLAGHQTEAYSSLIALGVDRTKIQNDPDLLEVRVQFVDIHGQPLSVTDSPLSELEFEPPLAVPGPFETRPYYTFDLPDPTKPKFKITVKPSLSPGSEEYKHHFHHAAIWPGFENAFKLVNETEGLTFDLHKDITFGDPLPSFLRLCLFHPAHEFQTTAGGNLSVDTVNYFGTTDAEKQATFEDNRMRLYTTRNQISLYNTGEAFLSDYHKTVGKLKSGDRLYQANWLANAHLHMLGSRRTRLIGPNDADPDTIQATLNQIIQNALLVPLDDPGTGDPHDVLLIPRHEQALPPTGGAFEVEIKTVQGAGDPKPKRTHRGFVRPGALFGWKLKGKPDLTDHTIHAYWKNRMGLVQERDHVGFISDMQPPPLAAPLPPLPDGILALDIDTQDSPQAILRRTASVSSIETQLGLPSGLPLAVLIINLASGFHHKVPLAGGDPAGTNVTLITMAEDEANGIPGMTGDDPLAIALIEEQPPDLQDLTTTLNTSFKTFEYDETAHNLAQVPRLSTELGGLLRKAISEGVEVRALMWEQILNRLGSSDNVLKGHANNEQIVNLINRDENGKRGYAFLDQATRELGAWHQKGTAIFQEVPPENLGDPTSTKGVAYLGGMDLALNRWDGEYYFERDPDRQGGKRYDVHMRFDGDAAWDVVRNFHHRWKGIDMFFQQDNLLCSPLNDSPELRAEVEAPFMVPNPQKERIKYPKEPNAFVQINRTMPAFTCFSGTNAGVDGMIIPVDGELGSLASYTKGISNARKFIFINEQYFFNQDLARAIRDALLSPNGPEFAVIVLPVELEEHETIDPLFFKLREKVLNILFYGSTTNPLASTSCGQVVALDESSTPSSVRDRVAVLTPVNHKGEVAYVHSKHIIVDDAWMTIGSANMSNRGMTYEMEINAACVGQQMYEGGTSVVRNQRIELCRRLLGLPAAYSAALEDPFAMFRLFKAIEAQQDSFDLNIYPLKPMMKWLDPSFVKPSPGTPFTANIDVNDESFNYMICNLLDADGRTHNVDQLGYLAQMAGLGKLLSYALGNLGLVFDTTCETDILNRINLGNTVKLALHLTIHKEEDPDGDGTTEIVTYGPYEHASFFLQEGNGHVELQAQESNLVTVIISTEHQIDVSISVTDETAGTALSCTASHTFDPSQTTINYGEEVNVTLTIA